MFDKDARRLVFSRMLRRPIALMQKSIDCSLGRDTCENPDQEVNDLTSMFTDNLKYMVYSCHDDQLSNIMEWLNPNNVHMEWILYAS